MCLWCLNCPGENFQLRKIQMSEVREFFSTVCHSRNDMGTKSQRKVMSQLGFRKKRNVAKFKTYGGKNRKNFYDL